MAPTSLHQGLRDRVRQPVIRQPTQSIGHLLQQLPKRSECYFHVTPGHVVRGHHQYPISKIVFVGPNAGGSLLRVGVFAGIHGDEPAGSHALVRFLARLAKEPALARGIELHAYPVSNPSGFEIGTRTARGGPDLNREFWTGSREPEVRVLERELAGLNFDGIVSLHADDTSKGIYGYASSDVLDRELLRPALEAASTVHRIDRRKKIDGWAASGGIIADRYPGILSAPPWQRPRPFEIIFETPGAASLESQIAAHELALEAILDAAIRLRAHAADI